MNNTEYWKSFYDNRASLDPYKSPARSGLMPYDEMAEILDKFLKFKKEDSVADIGGANGGVALEVHEMVGGIVISDISSGQIECAKKIMQQRNIKNVTCICTALPDLGELPDEAFDKAYAGGVFMYVSKDELQEAMQNMFRILKVGGQILIFHIFSEEMKSLNPEGRYNHLVSFYNFEELKRAALEAGFKSCEKINFMSNAREYPERWKNSIQVDNPHINLSVLLNK